MTERKQLKATVRIYEDARRRYEALPGDKAWMVYDRLWELIPAGGVNVSTTDYSTLVQFGGSSGNKVHDAVRVTAGDIDGVILTPVIDETTAIRDDCYEVKGTGGAPTLEVWKAEQWPFDIIAQPVGVTDGGAPVHSTVDSEYSMIADPFFTVMIWRKGLDEDFLDDVEAGTYDPPFTEIVFGNDAETRWALTIPYNEPPYLWQYDPTDDDAETNGWVRREWSHGSLSVQKTRGDAPDGFWYWIGVIDGKICVSEDRFQDDFAYYSAHPIGHEAIKPGPLQINHWPGMFAFAHRPLKAETATLTRQSTLVPNEGPWSDSDGTINVASRITGEVYGHGLSDYIATAGCLSAFSGTGFGKFKWTLTMAPKARTSTVDRLYADGGDLDVVTYTWPTIKTVRTTYEATITDNGAQPYTNYEAQIPEIHQSVTAEQDAASFQELYLINAKGEAKGIVEGRAVEIFDAGWEYRTGYGYGYWEEDEDLHALDLLWTLEPTFYDIWAAVPLTDLLGLLRLQQIKSPMAFMGFQPAIALTFLAQYAGLGPGWYDFEDLGIPFWSGSAPTHQPLVFDAGTTVADIMREVAKIAGNAAVWCEYNVLKTGCPYCRTKRTSEDWQSHQDGGWNSSGCLAADVARAGPSGVDKVMFANPEDATTPTDPNELLSMEVTRRNIDRWDYANEVTVIGKSANAETIGTTYCDWQKLYGTGDEYFGWPISHVEVADHLGDDPSRSKLNSYAQGLYSRLSPNPKWLRATCMAQTGLRLGHVIQVEGGRRWDLDGEKYRVAGMNTTLNKSARAVTEIIARRMEAAN